MHEKDLPSEPKVLLAKEEKAGSTPKLVKGQKDGKLSLLDPLKTSGSNFLMIDRHANPLENFFKNFTSQAKDPSRTGFFVVAISMLDKLVKMDEKELESYRVHPHQYLKEEQQNEEKQQNSQKMNNMEQKAATQKKEFKQLDISQIPESEYKKLGITAEVLKDELKAMSYGYKSPHLVDIKPRVDGQEFATKARISIVENPDGSLSLKSHPHQQSLDLDKPFLGVMLNETQKQNLLSTGNAGELILLNPDANGEPIPSLVSIDKLTNRLEAVAADGINVSENLKGATLSEQQINDIKSGKKVLVEQMVTKKTFGTDQPQKFDAYVQFNAARGSYDFSYDGLKNSRKQSTEKEVRIPNKLLGVQLDQKQKDAMKDGHTVYIQGMIKDGQDKPFNAYVKVNPEKNKLDFFKWNPDRAKKQSTEVKPAHESKTQVAANNQGKTNEATKHVKEPLKQRQNTAQEDQKSQAAKAKRRTSPKL